MLTELEFAVHRFATYAREVLKPAIYEARRELAAKVFQCSDPIGCSQAVQADYRPVEIGWRWGPAWSTAWFHITGSVPGSMAGRSVALRFSSGTEALWWRNGVPQRGFDRNRDSVILFEPAAGGEAVDLHIEAACNHPFGITAFAWDPPETQARWESETPGQLQRCELANYNHEVWRLWHAYEFARQLLAELPEDSPRAQVLYRGLSLATRLIDDGDVVGTAGPAMEVVCEALRSEQGAAATRCCAIGHAHIDTAWLWPVRETKRKCLRSFANVLELMDRFPDFRFLCSQAQQYEWTEQESPELFDRIRTKVRSGQWEPGGAMWVEPDCNVTGGESLIRQILYGTRYWREKFGDNAPQRYLYLPDTFGFTAALPQIMVQAGLTTFITNKLSWNQLNEWPHAAFIWRGIDGSEVLAHCTPGKDYNATNSPRELRRGEMECARKDKGRTGVWLQPFGYGDGGGGPTAEMIDSASLAAQCEGLPNVLHGRAAEMCDELHARREALAGRGDSLPVWDGELYLELHRGTLTTQSWLKRANRKAERDLRTIEWLSSAAMAPCQGGDVDRAELDEIWKLVLMNQFHDILPGTSIGWVYGDAMRDYERIGAFCDDSINRLVEASVGSADTQGLAEPMLVVNPSSHARGGVIECDGSVCYIQDVPALSTSIVDRAAVVEVEPAVVDRDVISNGIIAARIDGEGRIASLRVADRDREVGAPGDDGEPQPINQLVVYEDRPQAWEAWDIDSHYLEKAKPVAGPVESWEVLESSPVRAAIEVTRKLGEHSRIRQRYILEAGSPRLDIRTWVDWHESRRLLRALFPVDVRSRRATYEIQFGHLDRPTHRNTTWDEARFEVCAHSWMELSEAGFGVALLNDGKYGHSCHDNVMGITLLRSSKHPDPNADMGEHEFTYSIMPHGGDWRAAGVDRQAHELNTPLLARALEAGQAGHWSGSFAPVAIATEGAAHVVVSALKRAEDGDRTIIRLVETHGGAGAVTLQWNAPVSSVDAVDLLEKPTKDDNVRHDSDARTTFLYVRPFQIITLAAS